MAMARVFTEGLQQLGKGQSNAPLIVISLPRRSDTRRFQTPTSTGKALSLGDARAWARGTAAPGLRRMVRRGSWMRGMARLPGLAGVLPHQADADDVLSRPVLLEAVCTVNHDEMKRAGKRCVTLDTLAGIGR